MSEARGGSGKNRKPRIVERRQAAPLSATKPRACLDRKTFEKFCEAYPALFDRLLETFASHLPQQMLRMQQALAAGDSEGIKGVAHSLKSSAANIGALALAGQCREIEDQLRSRNGDSALRVEQMVDALQGEAIDVLAAVKNARAELATNDKGTKPNAGSSTALEA